MHVLRTKAGTPVQALATACILALMVTLTSLVTTPSGADAGVLRPLRDRVAFGAYVGGMAAAPSRLTSFETKVGARAAVASYYYGYGDVFPGALEKTFSDGGRRSVLLSWDMGPTRFTEWSSGKQDRYLDQIVAAARSYRSRVYVRPWPEMNGDWQDFQPTAAGEKKYGGTYAQFKAAWRHVVGYTRSHGATNLKWVFNPTADTYAETTDVRSIWPGASYVDVLGLDGFNWGKDASWGTWKSFTAIFRTQYDRLAALHPTAPVWICEVASKEPTRADGAPVDPRHDKGTWITSAMGSTGFSRLKVVIWFDEAKERDWRVDSSRTSLLGVRRVLG